MKFKNQYTNEDVTEFLQELSEKVGVDVTRDQARRIMRFINDVAFESKNNLLIEVTKKIDKLTQESDQLRDSTSALQNDYSKACKEISRIKMFCIWHYPAWGEVPEIAEQQGSVFSVEVLALIHDNIDGRFYDVLQYNMQKKEWVDGESIRCKKPPVRWQYINDKSVKTMMS